MVVIGCCVLTFITVARAYYASSSKDPENLTRAETALQELITSVDGLGDNVGFYQWSTPVD